MKKPVKNFLHLEEETEPAVPAPIHADGVYDGYLYLGGSVRSLEGVGGIVYWQDGRGNPHCHLKDPEGNLIKPALPITDAGQFEEILDPVIRYLRACGQLAE
jgi:hypothetical protein